MVGEVEAARPHANVDWLCYAPEYGVALLLKGGLMQLS